MKDGQMMMKDGQMMMKKCEMMKDDKMTKGGEMMGRILTRARIRFAGTSVRVRVKANRNPTAVPPSAVRQPIRRLFQRACRMNQLPRNSR